MTAGAELGKQVHEDDRAHVFHSWSAQSLIDPLPVAGAEGSYFWDFEGNRYLDFSAQLANVNIGHQHPRVVAAIRRQAGLLCTISPHVANDVRGRAARLIAERAPAGLDRVMFTNSGAEAVENAVRMARLHTGRPKVLAPYRSYHGSTGTAIGLTGDQRRIPNDAAGHADPLVRHFFGPYLYRSAFHATTEPEECERALTHLRDLIELEGPATIAAIVMETVIGGSGLLVPPDGYLAGVRELCDRYGLLLVLDEVMCGFGRTGAWFAFDHWGVVPDLVTFAKGVNSGYVPLGGVIVSQPVYDTFAERAYPGGHTYSGHPLACAAAEAAIEAMAEEDVIGNAGRLGGEVLGPGLRALAGSHPSVGDVRGIGAFWAVELVKDRATREPLVPYGAAGAANRPMLELLAACRSQGLWVLAGGNRVHVTPPCTLTAAEAADGIAVLDRVLDLADQHGAG
ncbi:aspartate aminotransferase family protein [Actinomadura macrotermitis]|uniref:Taurine--pyruvate aminotransferase n=1 Tax=Actinomadura macrotermitis TaxID=2585200 RepID=A0A7K0C8A0_9ACTN|nr:aspartate aminotransferase family protein [Actinomadura macrotermitis]MQY09711.1 Taurine--pyruvate aminotransferase [Actinomadura macrotermitis]